MLLFAILAPTDLNLGCQQKPIFPDRIRSDHCYELALKWKLAPLAFVHTKEEERKQQAEQPDD
jgi:hypothetical protein